MKAILKNNPYVQSPIIPEVRSLLSNISVSDTYFRRGSKQATSNLKRVIEKHRLWISDVIDLSEFPYCYATAGATEAINLWRTSDKRPWQMLEGDYQWPNALTQDGIITSVLDRNKVLYISNPQCANGNFIDNEFIETIDSPVIYDCAYLGATRSKNIGIPKRTEQIMFSFSKGWGLVGQRCGLLYCKQPHPCLDKLQRVECWNYGIPAIIETIIDNFNIDTMYNHFAGEQARLCDIYNLKASDTFFIATSEDKYYLNRRRKNNEARLCLTPLMQN